MVEDVGGDGLTVCFNTTLVPLLMIVCVLYLFLFSLGSMNGTTKNYAVNFRVYIEAKSDVPLTLFGENRAEVHCN